MKKKHTPGDPCGCGDGCTSCIAVSLDNASDWTAVSPGTIDKIPQPVIPGQESDIVFDLNGEVSPASFINCEAYEFRFTLTQGEVELTINGDVFVCDADAQTVDVNPSGTAVNMKTGLTTRTPLEQEVRVRATPTHTLIYVVGNYGSAAYVLPKVADPVAAFSCTWTNARITNPSLTSSQVRYVYDGQGALVSSLDCWDVPNWVVPYQMNQKASNNHEYLGDPLNSGEDIFYFPNITYTGYDYIEDSYRDLDNNPFPWDTPLEIGGAEPFNGKFLSGANGASPLQSIHRLGPIEDGQGEQIYINQLRANIDNANNPAMLLTLSLSGRFDPFDGQSNRSIQLSTEPYPLPDLDFTVSCVVGKQEFCNTPSSARRFTEIFATNVGQTSMNDVPDESVLVASGDAFETLVGTCNGIFLQSSRGQNLVLGTSITIEWQL
ncbi:MAG: hypothetical protein AAFV88_25730 [Planctomycetota bacterium]